MTSVACRIAAALCLAAVAPTLHAQAARVSATGHVITITNGRTRHRITLPDSVRVDMDTVEVLDSQNIFSTSYLLLVVKGPSKRDAMGAGHCGAGSETAIVWVELLAWRIRHSKSQLVESCLQNTYITGTIDWTADQMQMKFSDIDSASRTRVLRYDRLNPERGFTVTPDSSAK
ncbi:MAG: hypothetical protein H7099_06835 [Gemmatimonadaceae bacterium]|nr:hypothetical protein [Gemmatimonadaceae bacterium]